MGETTSRTPPCDPLHVVVTCTNRKKTAVPDRLRLREVGTSVPGPRFAAWTRRLSATDESTLPARDLYAGEHWQTARTLADLTAWRPTTLWVCSAGYGIIPVGCPISPYSATFAGGPDSVGASRADVQDWWARLTEWEGPSAGQPRSFTDLARRDPAATFVVVLSAAYQRACAEDLVSAAGRLPEDRLSVIGPPADNRLSDLVVPVTGDLRTLVGGSLLALNARVTAHLLRAAVDDQGDLGTPHLRELIRDAARSTPPDQGDKREGLRLTDEEVRRYVRSHLDDHGSSATRLLRQLRQSGRSCEQSRFHRLFAEVTQERADV